MEAVGIRDLAEEPLNELSGGSASGCSSRKPSPAAPSCSCSTSPRRIWTRRRGPRRGSSSRRQSAAGPRAVIATHDIEAAAACEYTMLLARRLVAYGPSEEVLRADALLETFGVLGKTEGERVLVLGREHEHECGDER